MKRKTDEKRSDFGEVLDLVEELFSTDGMERHEARVQLEKKGTKVTPLLIGTLKADNTDVRWEAAKALIAIKDPLAANALTESMMDEDYEVRWLAAEALIELGEEAVIPILRKLLGHYDSLYLRKGAHHVLNELKSKRRLDDEIAEVLGELGEFSEFDDVITSEPYPLIAKNVLESLLMKKPELNSTEPDTTKETKPKSKAVEG